MRKKEEKIIIEFDVEYDEIEWKGSWIPKTLYKYRDWENKYHKNIIFDNLIYIPDSVEFNDPFDCNIPVDYGQLLTDDKVAEAFIRRIVGNHRDKFSGSIEEEVQKRIKEGKHKDPKFIKEYSANILLANQKANGVLSLTAVNNNILMWSHYANSHKGYCVGFDSIKLFGSIKGGGGKVAYSSTYPIISPVEDRDKQYGQLVMTKSIHWKYEIEYRLTTLHGNNFNFQMAPDTITEVIFGARMLENYKTEIRKIIKEKHPNVKIFNSTIDAKDFKLNILQE